MMLQRSGLTRVNRSLYLGSVNNISAQLSRLSCNSKCYSTTPPSETKDEKTSKLKEFRHDYGVLPDTYSYTTDLNNDLFQRFPLLSTKRAARNTDRPRKVRMLARDFIDDSLYNPTYGYFSKEVEIFQPDKPFDYNHIKDIDEFMVRWKDEYQRYEDPVEPKSKSKKEQKAEPNKVEKKEAVKNETTSEDANKKKQIRPKESGISAPKLNPPVTSSKGKSIKAKKYGSRQLWHTPTELFQPYYGQALARYLLVNYKLSLFPYADLTIYEMGGGNGTLMINILDYIRETQPDVYSRTRYKIIEISGNLASKQQESLKKRASSQGHLDKIEIINKSIFEWNQRVPDPCFFIALEVFDNFAHDVIRYDNETLRPYQAYVVTDAQGDFHEVYSPDLDPLAARYLQLREDVGGVQNPVSQLGYHPLAQPYLYRRAKNLIWPFRENLSDAEYIPTRYLEFCDVLRKYFPEHSLLTSDFTHLPQTCPGYAAPVVQTVLNGTMVPVETYMVLQGFFDILFPTDFDTAAAIYRKVCNKVVKTETHKEFLEQWADIETTSTRAGENPMLEFYQNAAFMFS